MEHISAWLPRPCSLLLASGWVGGIGGLEEESEWSISVRGFRALASAVWAVWAVHVTCNRMEPYVGNESEWL